MLKLSQFKKSYGGKSVLDIPSFVFSAGIHWLQGKNGSGKSTLFRCIAGISPFEGEIRLQSWDAKKDPAQYRLHVNYSEAEPLFPGFLSGREMLEFAAEAKCAEGEQLEKLCDAFSLKLFYENPASTYSSGMAKKVSLVMAFLGRPELIVLDEPFITLDQDSVSVLSELISTCRNQGISFLISSHPDFQNAGFSADYVWKTSGGSISAIQ